LHDKMGLALAAADLVISRAGASTLGEFPHFGIPAILVPYPHAWRYQYVNAHYLERHGAAVVLEDAYLAEQLIETVESLMGNNSRREQMSHAMRSLDRPNAARSIWTMITNLVFGEDRKGTQ
jgi:UDP-N-acetylglucosamine:LPS N-acetylglucosamine transferase